MGWEVVMVPGWLVSGQGVSLTPSRFQYQAM